MQNQQCSKFNIDLVQVNGRMVLEIILRCTGELLNTCLDKR